MSWNCLCVILITTYGIIHCKAFLEISKLATSIGGKSDFKNQVVFLTEILTLKALIRFLELTYCSKVRVELVKCNR